MARVLVLLFAAAALHAAGPARKVFPFPYRQADLSNGLRLITIPTDYPNIVALYIVVQAGSRNEVEPGKTGFAHLFEHMMFRGTAKYPPAKYEAVLKAAGAASNAYTTDDHTAYHTTFSKEDLETILQVEADRFQNLKYPEPAFRTESLAVLGEYNKNSAAPTMKLFEVLRDTAFDRHTYKHTTMGFLKDIQDMPGQYQYSLQFFDRYYRPEYTTLIVSGDVDPARVLALVEKYWGQWQRGSYRPRIPAEPAQTAPRSGHVDWPVPTLPWVIVAYKGPAYTDTAIDSAALDLLGAVAFSENSDLYQKLVIEEQKADIFGPDNPDRLDPYLFSIEARVKKASDLDAVRDAILKTVDRFRTNPVSRERLEAVKSNLRYSFALRMDNSETIASTVARYVALRRTPETINRIYDMYAKVTPDDILQAARKYLAADGRTIVTLTGAARAAQAGGKAQ
ncbi:MAG: insulinase family protein [Bryobacterales bacterium]|nr:insulinase family protein [Bryobacterales bacterium]